MRCDLRLQVVLQPAFGKYISHYLFVRVVGLLEIVFRRGISRFLTLSLVSPNIPDIATLYDISS